jgi:hypothetical protein
MAGGVFTNNTTIKVSAAVSASGTGTTLYTCPANAYAILNVYASVPNGVTGTVTVDGKEVLTLDNNGSTTIFPKMSSGNGYSPASFTIYVGPSQAVACTSSGGSATVKVTGVQFINSP